MSVTASGRSGPEEVGYPTDRMVGTPRPWWPGRQGGGPARAANGELVSASCHGLEATPRDHKEKTMPTTVLDLRRFKGEGQRFVMLTCYDYQSRRSSTRRASP